MGHKITVQKSSVFLYASNKEWESEIKKIIPKTAWKIKHLGIHITKEI